jgi:hypothetical protein
MHFKLLLSATLAGLAIANPDVDDSDDYEADGDIEGSNPIAARTAAPVNPASVFYYAMHPFPSAENMEFRTNLVLKHPSSMEWKPQLNMPQHIPVEHDCAGKVHKHGHVSSISSCVRYDVAIVGFLGCGRLLANDFAEETP